MLKGMLEEKVLHIKARIHSTKPGDEESHWILSP